MNSVERIIFVVSADAAITQHYVSELVASGGHYQMPLAVSVSQARKSFRRLPPAVILLDESAIDSGESGASLETSVALLTEAAPVVVVAAPERQAELTFLITSGAVDFVARAGNFVPVAAGLLERRVRLAEQAESQAGAASSPPEGDFGEVLRHEVNNPLTGILGNAELLLRERERLPQFAVQRLQTIAELAVRLRETVRRLSTTWDERHDHAGSTEP